MAVFERDSLSRFTLFIFLWNLWNKWNTLVELGWYWSKKTNPVFHRGKSRRSSTRGLACATCGTVVEPAQVPREGGEGAENEGKSNPGV
jgi:hypothetical protein